MVDPIQEYVEHWLIKAGRDLRSAQNDYRDSPPITDTVCYHSQQAAEKSLKAILAFHRQEIPKVHFLPLLLDTCANYHPAILRFHEAAKRLAEYATSTRYPDDWREIPVEEALEALGNATEIYDFVRKIIKPGDFNETVRPLSEVEREAIVRAIERTSGNLSEVARMLGLSRATLYKKLKEYRINR